MKIGLNQAQNLLSTGHVVAVPTETVYGLAALLCQEKAILEIFHLKKRPATNPLIIHVGTREQCIDLCEVLPPGFFELTDAFWPGALTLILPIIKEKVPSIARANLAHAAFRMPKHELAQKLLLATSPFVAPSANLSGSPSATRPEHVENDFGQDFPLLDGGSCQHGVESTILAYQDAKWQIARLGAITAEQIALSLGYLPPVAASINERPICPGQHFQHYAPKARLVLSTSCYTECTQRLPVVIGFGDREYEGAKKIYLLSERADADMAAHQLYDTLRQLDLDGIDAAWVDMLHSNEGLWQTLSERLNRAASR